MNAVKRSFRRCWSLWSIAVLSALVLAQPAQAGPPAAPAAPATVRQQAPAALAAPAGCPPLQVDPVTGAPANGLPLSRNPHCYPNLRLPVPAQGPAVSSSTAQPPRQRASAVVGANRNISRLSANQNEPTIVINPLNHSQMAVFSNDEGLSGGLFSAYSIDGGANWITRTLFTSGATTACCDPQAVFDRFGNLFLTYLGSDGNVYLALSSDGGQTFPTVFALTSSGNNDQPSVAVGPSYDANKGSVWVSYNDGTSIAARGALVGALGNVGAFNPAESAPGNSGSFGSIAIGPAGQVLVTYQDDGDNSGAGPAHIYVNLDSNGLQSDMIGFGPQITAAVTQVGSFRLLPAQSNNYGIDAEASLAWDYTGGPHNGRVYLVYTDAANYTTNDTDIVLRYSDNNGSTWSDPVRVNDDVGATSQFLPGIALDRTNGHIGVAWYDARNDPTNNTKAQLFAAVSDNGGTAFAQNFPVAAYQSDSSLSEPPGSGYRPLGYGDYNLIDFDGGQLAPVWADNSAGLGGNPDVPGANKLDLATARVTINPTSAVISATAGSGQNAALGAAFAVPLQVTVSDGAGHPVSSAPILFTAPVTGASALLSSPMVLTDLAGRASVTATANYTNGSYLVKAVVNGTSLLATFALANVGAATITPLEPISQSTVVNTAFAAPLQVSVHDAAGAIVAGAVVTFTAPAGGPSAVLPLTATTDAQGTASVTAAANPVSGRYTMTATTAGAAAPALFQLTNLAGPPADIRPIGIPTRTQYVNSTFSLAVTVVDQFGNPAPGAAVAFSASHSGSGASALLSSPVVLANLAGQASVAATANMTTGSYLVTAVVSGTSLLAAFSVTNFGVAAIITPLEPISQSTVVNTAFAAPLRVSVRDADGASVVGAVVTFTAPAGGPSAVLPLMATTDAQGMASVIAVANTVSGRYAMTATMDGAAAPALFQLTNLAGPPADIQPVGIPTRTQYVNSTFVLSVTVNDQFGNPTPGAVVAFSASNSGSGASALLSSPVALANLAGQASVAATANMTAGSYLVTAVVSGTSLLAAFRMTNFGAATIITPLDPISQSTVVNTAFAAPLRVSVHNLGGASVAGAVVMFTVPAGGPSALLPLTATTDASGTASVTAAANTVSGRYAMTATTAGVAAPALFQLTNLAGLPADIQPGGTPTRTQYLNSTIILSVTVTDQFGNPTPGVAVTFSAPDSGPGASLSPLSAASLRAGAADVTVVSSDIGVAAVAATANDVIGSYTVTAQMAGAPPVRFNITNREYSLYLPTVLRSSDGR